MNGIHDMGGMHGYGAVDPSDDVLFHDEWEARVLALTIATSPHLQSNLDYQRYRLEILPPDQYLTSYYERWYLSMLDQCVSVGLIDEATRDAIERGENVPASDEDGTALDPEIVKAVLASGAPANRDAGPAPLFKRGDKVRTVNKNPASHTRLPRYARGKIGEIIAHHGNHVFPDSNAQNKGEDPQPIYTVRFTARALWGQSANSRDSVALELWQPHLQAVG